MKRLLPALLLLLGSCKEKTYFSPIKGAPPDVEELVYWGDKLYAQGMSHRETFSFNDNPEGWKAEARKAMGFFKKALEENYEPALRKYTRADDIPAELEVRIVEANFQLGFCREIVDP